MIRFGAKLCGLVSHLVSGYFVGGRELLSVQSHRDLGVTMDNSLRFHMHIDVPNILHFGKTSGLANQL